MIDFISLKGIKIKFLFFTFTNPNIYIKFKYFIIFNLKIRIII